jgi:hypothetical protein
MIEPIEEQMNDFLDGSMEVKGKNFSRNRARADRMEADFYQTPHCLTQTFIDSHVKSFWDADVICDYCSGAAAIVKVLNDNGYKVQYGDIADPIKTDFFNIGHGEPYGIMNPPFRLFNQWVEHCFEVFDYSFALLGPTTYLQGIHRYNKEGTGIFQNEKYPLTHIYTFNRYPMLSARLRPDGLIETGMQALSWYVWTKDGHKGYSMETIHRWLDIDQFVLRKGKRGKQN